MDLPVRPPVAPMLARAARGLPEGEGFLFEPKWDGFRAIVFRDGDEVEIGSRNERPLTRYFPELLDPVRDQLPSRVVLDGEVVIARTLSAPRPGPQPRPPRQGGAPTPPAQSGLDFEALLQRIHPAESRIRRLAAEMPASFVAFDLLALGDHDARPLPLAERRRLLVEVMADVAPPLYLTPATTDRGVALDWFTRFEGAGLDGVVAKPLGLPYREGERLNVKVKHERTADCVVGGFRWHKSGPVVGSLLLGLYDAEGVLHHVGVAASFPMARRRELVEELAPYREGALENHPWRDWAEASAEAGGQRLPGATSRWNATKDLSWEPLRPELVCEVAYDHLQGTRFRHATQFRRWRPDRTPPSCTYEQLDVAVPEELAVVFGA